MINSMQAHVLVDLNGYTDGGRPEIGVLRPAPVVVTLRVCPSLSESSESVWVCLFESTRSSLPSLSALSSLLVSCPGGSDSDDSDKPTRRLR